LDIGNGSGFTRTTLTAGANVTITNSAGGITIAASGGGGGVTSVSGTGTVNGITLSGTVTSTGNLTLGGTLSGVSLTSQVSGTLPVANGGTGATSSTGSGNVVLATSPTITTPTISGNTTVNSLRLGNGISSGANNTVFGLEAGNAQTTGIANTLVGMRAGYSLTSGTQNTFFGRSAGTSVTTQNNNTCIGYNTAVGSAIGANNTAIGHQALFNTTSTTATFNTAVGSNALSTLDTYTNCAGLGADAAVTGSNQVQLGDSSTTTYVYGTVQNRSDLRDKADVRDTQLGLSFVNALRPVDYKWDLRDSYKPPMPDPEDKAAMAAWREASKIENLTHDGSKKRSRFHHGLIAQEVKAVLDAQGIDFGGFQDHKIAGGNDVLTIGYDELIAPLIKAIQELTARVQELEAKA
jgi:hypothetical protein